VGPIALFDKSFLQSLSVDKALWFDHFFMPVICPVFYIETLGNLAKQGGERPPETMVRETANKCPESGGAPCSFHIDLVISNLLGHHVPLNGQIPRSRGRPVKSGIVYDQNR
jgi:hypothetical protein